MRAALIAVMLMIASQAGAVDILKLCHPWDDRETRLDCYDQFTRFNSSSENSLTEDSKATAVVGGTQWRHNQGFSEMYGTKHIWLSVISTNTQRNRIEKLETAWFGLRCMDNKTNLFIRFEDYINEDQNVRYKTDNDSIKSVWMRAFKTNDGVGIFSGRKAIPFIKKLADKKQLIVRFKSYSNASLEFIFDISGLRSQVKELADACEWSLN